MKRGKKEKIKPTSAPVQFLFLYLILDFSNQQAMKNGLNNAQAMKKTLNLILEYTIHELTNYNLQCIKREKLQQRQIKDKD